MTSTRIMQAPSEIMQAPSEIMQAPSEWAAVFGRHQEGECWLWWRKLMKSGYGQLRASDEHGHEGGLVHRLSYELWHGKPAYGWVKHTCENRHCYRPDHLYESETFAPEVRGERVNTAKLNPDKVREIRRLLAAGHQLLYISKLYGIAPNTVAKIRDGKTWSHVEDHVPPSE